MFDKLKKAGGKALQGAKEAAKELKGEETVTISKVEYEMLLSVQEDYLKIVGDHKDEK